MQMNEEGEKNEKENDDILGVDLFTTAYRRDFLIFSSRANPGPLWDEWGSESMGQQI